ncbi:hypothetical protein PMAYCL1PPCAC_21969, partial [Pristionchus mayeri]
SFAVKKFIDPFKHEKRAQRCHRELQILKALEHDNIVKMIGVYTTDPCKHELENIYLVTEYCGPDLAKILSKETEQNHIFDIHTIRRMISELLQAVKYLNSAGVIYRDIKPENMAINRDGKLTLIEFGFARAIDKDDMKMTRDPGSSLYRAIETISFLGDENMVYTEKGTISRISCKHVADIWSIGALFCEMVIGTPIFE